MAAATKTTSGPITAEQHNETRRAVKARQRSNRKKGGFGGDGVSVLEAARKDKQRAERRAKLQAENEQRLLAKLLKAKRLVISEPDEYAMDLDEHIQALRRFERNVADVIRAATEDAKGGINRYRWEHRADGKFIIHAFK